MSTPTWITLANANTFSQTASGTATAITQAGPVGGSDVSPGGNVAGQAFQTQPAQLYPGQQWRFTANGIWSTTSSPGVAVGVSYGGAAGSPLCYASVPAAWAFTNCASIPWTFQAMGRVTATGSSTAAWNVVGYLAGLSATASAAAGPTGTANGLPTSIIGAPQYTATAQYDTSTAKLITLVAFTSASAAGNVMTVYNWTVEYMTEP